MMATTTLTRNIEPTSDSSRNSFGNALTLVCDDKWQPQEREQGNPYRVGCRHHSEPAHGMMTVIPLEVHVASHRCGKDRQADINQQEYDPEQPSRYLESKWADALWERKALSSSFLRHSGPPDFGVNIYHNASGSAVHLPAFV